MGETWLSEGIEREREYHYSRAILYVIHTMMSNVYDKHIDILGGRETLFCIYFLGGQQ